jgi:SH3-like domain-containing protein
VTGYKKIGDYYYLFNSSGIMRTGTVKSDDKQYVLGSSGKSTLYTAKTKDVLNYRTGPGTSYKVKGTYKKGKTISVIREKNGWGKTRDGYWVKLNYTKKVTSYPKFISFKVKTTDDLNYRTGPGTSYKKKGMYKKGKTLTIVNKKNGWGKTSTGYWVKLEYTKRI